MAEPILDSELWLKAADDANGFSFIVKQKGQEGYWSAAFNGSGTVLISTDWIPALPPNSIGPSNISRLTPVIIESITTAIKKYNQAREDLRNLSMQQQQHKAEEEEAEHWRRFKSEYDPMRGGGKSQRSTPGTRACWKATRRTHTCRDGRKRTLYTNPAKPGEVRVRKMVKRHGQTKATYVKP
jgi:hypothetical protein